MGYISEPTDWADQIFRKETNTPVLGDISGPSNTQAKELAGRTQKIKSVLNKNAIFIDDAEFEYQGQNFIFTTDFYSTVVDRHFVYWRESSSMFYKAFAGGSSEASKVIGVAIRTEGKIIVDGIVPYTNTFATGTIIYLSTVSGHTTSTDTGVPVGITINHNLLRLTLHQYYKVDGNAGTPSLRTLGTGSKQAAAGNDSRLIHTGDVTSNSSGATVIGAGKVHESMQSLVDNTTGNFSTSRHGYVPKGTNAGKYLKDDGSWSTVLNTQSWVPNDDRAKIAFNVTHLAPLYACRAWIKFSAASAIIRASGNISSITYQSTGYYRINFITALKDAHYSITGWASGVSSQYWASCVSSASGSDTYSASTFDIYIRNEGWNAFNPEIVNIHVVR